MNVWFLQKNQLLFFVFFCHPWAILDTSLVLNTFNMMLTLHFITLPNFYLSVSSFLKKTFFLILSPKTQGKSWSCKTVVLLGLLSLLCLQGTFEIYILLDNFFSHFLYLRGNFSLKKYFIFFKFLLSWNIVSYTLYQKGKKKKETVVIEKCKPQSRNSGSTWIQVVVLPYLLALPALFFYDPRS